MKKTVSLFLSLIMLLSAVTCVDFSAFAAASINSQEVSLYYLKSNYAEKISIPNSYNKSFQLRVSGASNVSYKVISGKSATVSRNGLIELKSTTWYWYGYIGSSTPMPEYGEPDRVEVDYEEGDTVIRVQADSQTFNVTVHVYNYAYIYADNVMDDYIKKNLKSSMTEYEKIELCAKFPASYDYNARYSSVASMIVFGGGDCWASTDAIIELAQKMGFKAWARNGNRDLGAGSGHMNAMVQSSDGSYYEVEAGYAEPSPRDYTIKKRTSLFSYKYYDPITVYQYDGLETPENLVVPDYIDGKKVNKIGAKFISSTSGVKSVVLPDGVIEIGDSAFNSCSDLKSITLPSSLSSLGDFVFTKCNSLTDIKSNSVNYPAANGFIYNKDKSVLLYAPAVTSINIPSSVISINKYAFYYNYNIKNAVIPATVTSLGEGAFGNCENLKSVTILNGKLSDIGKFAFAYCYRLEKIVLPECVSLIDENAFYSCGNLAQVTVINRNCVIGDDADTFPESAVLYGYTGSTLEAYAKKYGREFVSLDNCKHTSTTETVTKEPTCTAEGSKDVRCNVCDKVIKSVSVPKIAHKEVVDVKAVNATCTTAGKTKGSHCSVCGQSISVSKTIPAKGHSYNWQEDNGYLVKECGNCNDIITKLPFEDLGSCAFYGDYIEYTSSLNQFITGTNPPARTLFSPTTPITRAMFVTILYRMAGEPYKNVNPYDESPFTDITDTSVYYYDAACWALDKEITTQTTFKPFDNVSREQTASFLFRYAQSIGKLGSSDYKKVNLSSYPDYGSVHGWAEEAMQWANYNGMITGTQQNTLNPQGATQRVHATKILYGFGTVCDIGNFE